MYLKALEIQGFKSFPDKTRLTFEKDITAIVGPNGSGKSNISDAIMWVMGEQRSRALRGGKMEDVIFGGTEKRGKLGFAQVSLVVDNSEHIFNIESSEVMITRRYYRSGESEYYINRESVRLKDIHGLLMDTGLGRDGYSIIGQGRIAEIISAKSTDRREVFEEAAGISRYRYSKEESERKLEKTEENLLRIKDKIDEVEMQVEPLRKQSETAKKFLILRDELRAVEISVWLENLDRLREQSGTAAVDYERSKAELDAAHQALDAIYAATENYSEKMRECDVEAENLRSVLSETEGAQAECDSAAQVLRANLGNNTESIERMRREIREQTTRAEEIGEQISAHERRTEEIVERIGAIGREQESILSSTRDNEASGEDVRREIAALVARETELTAEIGSNQTAMSMLRDAAQELHTREAEITAESETAEQKLTEMETRLKADRVTALETKEKASELENRIAGYQLRLGSREENLAKLTDRCTKLTIDAKSMDARIHMLAEMEKEMEGFSRADKEIMQASQRGALRGIHGPVGRLVSTDDRYALAIETALGAAVQNIVVDDQDCGKSAIDFLKQRDSGRATFLPISVIRGQKLDTVPGKDEGCLGTALELVRYDAKYREIFANLLGRTVVAEALSDAVRIAKKYNNRFRIVTLDGQVLNAGGSMTGGSAARGTGMLSRASELKKLKARREELEKEFSEVSSKRAEAERELTRVRYELEVARDELRQAQEDALHAQSRVEQDELVFSAADEAMENLENEALSVKRRLKENAQRVQELQENTKKSEAALASVRAEIEAHTAGSEQYEARRTALTEALSALRSETASLLAERDTVRSAVEQLEALRAGISGDSAQREASIQSLEELGASLREALSVKEEQLAAYAERIASLKKAVSDKVALRMELEGARTKSEKAGQDKNRELLELERLCAKLEQRKQAFEMEERQIIDKLWDSYELSFSAAQAARQPIENLRESQKKVSDLKRQISALGNPNIGSIEEFERVNARYTFLMEQYDDVMKAKKELLGVISDITEEMREIFLTQFKAIEENFRMTFLELFGGGRASLQLEDENDVLNCGIEIKIQPPGKSLSTISLLSGGEKAFVAIALYFAIMKVRPTPFCVMDEIEAALDEANVIRFAEYMRTMTKRTQFIVITHRRGTMEEADVLYGVTMQEKGVSTVLSVDLEEAEKTIA